MKTFDGEEDVNGKARNEDEALRSEGGNATMDNDEAPIPSRDPFLPIPLHIETTLRMTITGFVAYCLAYAGTLGHVDSIPPSMAWLIGLIGTAVTTRLPVVAALPLALPLPGYTIVLFALGLSTALLCAATVSDGFFVACAALFGLWVAGLRFGMTGKAFNILAPLIVVIFGVIGLGLQPLVSDGITIKISREMLAAALNVAVDDIQNDQLLSQTGAESLDSTTILARISQFVQQFGGNYEALIETLNEYIDIIGTVIRSVVDLVRQGSLCFVFPLPGTFFSDQTVCAELTKEDLIINIEGGLWIVRRLWTTTGVNNLFAVISNFWVAFSWAALCVLFTGVILPPLRTIRYSFSRLALPNTLRDASWFLRRRLGEERETMSEEEIAVGRRLVKAVNLYHGGLLAIVTAFEPRLLDFRYNLPRCTWLRLIDVTKNVERAALTALASSVMYSRHASTDILTVCTSYEQSASALHLLSKQTTVLDEDVSAPMKQEDDPLGLEQSSLALAKSVDEWIESLHPTTTIPLGDSLKEIALMCAAFVGPTLLLLARLLQILVSPVTVVASQGQCDWYKVAHVIKFAIGFTALVCLSIYTDYRNLEVATTPEEDVGFEILNGTPITGFVGWHLMSYSFATMPTTEGTVKKCIFRVFGTLAGALSAFLLLRATGDNAYGSIAWLTITQFVAIYTTVEKSDSAILGPSKDFGYGGFYFILTQSVIVMEHLAGIDEGDDLVVNRLVSNLLGIGMATFLAIIPPTVMGGDPKWTSLMLQATKSSAEKLIWGILNGDQQSLVALKNNHSANFDALKGDAEFLLEDAKRGSFFPFYKVDERLEEEIHQQAITSAFLQIILDRAIVAMNSREGLRFDKGSQESYALFNILRSMREWKQEEVSKQDLIELSGDPAVDLIREIDLLSRRLIEHESNLDVLKGRGGPQIETPKHESPESPVLDEQAQGFVVDENKKDDGRYQKGIISNDGIEEENGSVYST